MSLRAIARVAGVSLQWVQPIQASYHSLLITTSSLPPFLCSKLIMRIAVTFDYSFTQGNPLRDI